MRALAVAALLALVAPIQIASAGADPGPRTGDFYRPPSALPAGAPGAVVRSERFPLALAVPGGAGQVPANATRIMYRSADTHGAPVAVTGTYLEPSAPWRGNGPRPLVAVAPGTQGQGDQCAPSKGFGEIAHVRAPLDIWVSYEVVTAYSLLARGMAVVMTDYYGLGTPAVHDYVNRRSSGQAVLDSIRAANALTGITRPTAIFGYSQGGGAAAAAAELQGEYAPELDVRGTYAGAPPADIRATMASPAIGGAVPGIGGFAAGLLGYVLNGVAADYPEARPVIDAALNPAGKALLAETARQCIGETAVRYLLRPMASFTAGGRSLAQIIDGSPVLRGIIDDQRIGRRTPVAPVLIASGTNDDVIPFGQVRQLAVDWCARGAAVRLEPVSWLPPLLPSTAVGHLAAFAPALGTAHDWLGRRLAGEPAASNCSALP